MNEKRTVIRDFLYVDLDRLYSLYSQAFEGVANQMIESFSNQAANKESGKGPVLSGRTIEDQVVELSTRTEIRWLHDHMYNALEERLSPLMLENPSLTSAGYTTALANSFLLKVHGSAEIHDFQRLKQLVEQFNQLGEAIAFSQTLPVAVKDLARHVESEIAHQKDANTRAKLREQLKTQTDPKKLAKESGLYQDPTLLKNLRLFVEFSNPGGFEITLKTPDGGGFAFKGVLDRRWLRMPPDLLRSLYGSSIDMPITMVGQVTHIPGLSQSKETSPPAPASDKASMRDGYRGMFQASKEIDRIFLESASQVEIVMCPLAIYRQQLVGAGDRGRG